MSLKTKNKKNSTNYKNIEYQKKNMKTKTISLRQTLCPKCGDYGTVEFLYKHNIKTNKNSGFQFIVAHNGRSCYLGMAMDIIEQI